jgi:8-oxo-dGTP diphosphatase
MTQAPAKITNVAVGVLVKPDGRVLYAQRLEGKPYAGWWEFPGGKQEAGETMRQALNRELEEELGIQVLRATQWVVRDHVYPHATVQLYFFKVDQWLGEPKSAEGQALRWLDAADRDSVSPVLPAAIPVIEWLLLPEQLQLNIQRDLVVGHSIQAVSNNGKVVSGVVCCDAAGLMEANQSGRDFVVLWTPELASDRQQALAVDSRLPVYTQMPMQGSHGLFTTV